MQYDEEEEKSRTIIVIMDLLNMYMYTKFVIQQSQKNIASKFSYLRSIFKKYIYKIWKKTKK